MKFQTPVKSNESSNDELLELERQIVSENRLLKSHEKIRPVGCFKARSDPSKIPKHNSLLNNKTRLR